MAARRSIDDYPEHLNPFREDDNHSKLRFWTLGRRRSSSFSFASMRDLKNSWKLGSFRKKGTNSPITACISAQNSPEVYRKNVNGNADSSPVMPRHASMRQSQTDRYVYAGSVTPQPLPRSRFRERISHLSTQTDEQKSEILPSPSASEHNKSIEFRNLSETKSERGSSYSLQSNQFENGDEFNRTPVRHSLRKKRRAPLPPPIPTISESLPSIPSIIVTEVSPGVSKIQEPFIPVKNLHEENSDDIDIDDPSFKTELKIVENSEIEISDNNLPSLKNDELHQEQTKDIPEEYIDNKVIAEINSEYKNNTELKDNQEKDNICNGEIFEKINISTYRRQQSNVEDMNTHTNSIDASTENIPILKTMESSSENIETKIVESVPPPIVTIPTSKPSEMTESEMSEFNEFDQIIQEIETNSEAILNLHEAEKNIIEKRRTISDMKLIFENANPLPKPRRTKLSNSSSSSESKTPSAPPSPIGNT